MKAYAHAHPVDIQLRRGEGYLYFMAYLQILAGVLSLLFSVFAIARAVSAGDLNMLNLTATTAGYDGSSPGFLETLLAGYMVVQLTFGWLMGLALIGSAICCLKHTGRRFIVIASVLNLFNFPHGTTVAIMMLHGLSRRGISDVFDEKS